jgi:fimbrial chaperone protein
MNSIFNATRTGTFLLLAFALLYGTAWAEGLNVRPIRVDMSNDERSAALTVTNQNEAPELLQVEGDTWDQIAGIDTYALIDQQLFIVPPVLSVDPGQSKIVRIGLRQPAVGSRERAFRVFITQVPSQLANADGVRVAFRVAIPIFVTAKTLTVPRSPVAAPALTWSAKLDGPKRVKLSVENPGDAHVHIDVVHIYADASQRRLAGDVTLSDYVLAGAARTFELDASADLTLPTVVVEGSDTNEQPFTVTVPVAWK